MKRPFGRLQKIQSIKKETTNMTNKPETLATTDLTVKELDQTYGVTEEELASVSLVCTCTCGLDLKDG